MPDFDSIMRSIVSGAGSLAGRAQDNLMPAPPGGLLSPEDLAAARRAGMLHLGMSLLGDTSGQGLGPALAQGLGAAQQGYQGAAANTMAMQAAAKQKQLLDQRQAIGQKYAPKPGETPNYAGMYADYMAAGDLDAARNVAQLVQEQMQAQARSREANKLQAVQAGDAIYTFDPKTGTYTRGPERHMNADELLDKQIGRQLQREQIASMRVAREQQQGINAGNAFMRQNADLVKTEQLYQTWHAAYESAKAGNPAAYKSAIVNFAATADPKAQIRLGVLNFIEKVDPSVKGRSEIAFQKLANGQFPQRVLDEMNRHVEEIHRNTVKIYESRRSGRVKAHPQWDQYIPPTSEVFPSSQTMAQPSAPAGESRVQQFLNGFKGN